MFDEFGEFDNGKFDAAYYQYYILYILLLFSLLHLPLKMTDGY